jgi:Thiamine pyrophosphate enzyme, N-terminal TPP binding domain/DeoC/LacD family aldolase
MARKPWAAVVEALEAEEVEYVFGLPGNPELLYNDLYGSSVKPVLVRMETSAVFMAMAYARVSGKVGVVHASPGPGMANLVPGLLEASYACSPLVCIVSAASRTHEGMGGFQDAPSLEMVKPVTKWAVRIDLPERTAWTMARAFAVAQNGKPGPVFVEIPGDVAGAAAEIPRYRRPLVGLRAAGDPAAIERAARLLGEAERPVIWAGGGVGLSGAELEEQGHEPLERGRLNRLQPPPTTACAAYKLLLYYRADHAPTASRQRSLAGEAAAAARSAGIPLVLEPLVYRLDGEDEAAYGSRFGEPARSAAADLAGSGAAVLKLQFPGDDCSALTDASALLPWALLGGSDVDGETFTRQLEVACDAGGSGFIAGRAIWSGALGLAAADADAWLAAQAAPLLARLGAVARERGRPL